MQFSVSLNSSSFSLFFHPFLSLLILPLHKLTIFPLITVLFHCYSTSSSFQSVYLSSLITYLCHLPFLLVSVCLSNLTTLPLITNLCYPNIASLLPLSPSLSLAARTTRSGTTHQHVGSVTARPSSAPPC